MSCIKTICLILLVAINMICICNGHELLPKYSKVYSGGALTLSNSKVPICNDNCDTMYRMEKKCMLVFEGKMINIDLYRMCIDDYERRWLRCRKKCRGLKY